MDLFILIKIINLRYVFESIAPQIWINFVMLKYSNLMGAQMCCGGKGDAHPARVSSPAVSDSVRELAHQICTSYQAVSSVQHRLDDLVYTDSQSQRLASISVEAIAKLSTQRQSPEHKAAIDKILSDPSIVENIQKEEGQSGVLYYQDVLQMAQKQLKSHQTLSYGSEMRIYHSVAGLKQKQFKQKSGQYFKKKEGRIVDSEKERWRFRFTGVDTQQKIDEIVRMEELAYIARRMGKESSVVLSQIQQQTNSMLQMLTETEFKQGEYSLSSEEVMEMALRARKANEIDHNGVNLLISYLRQAINHSIKRGKSILETEEALKKTVDLLTAQFPPGKGLQDHPQQVKEALKRLEIQGQNEGKFRHKPTVFTGSSEERTKQVRECILQYARLAVKNQGLFENLIRGTCLRLAVATLSGLKLNPDKPNDKALLRIQEKIFFKGEKYARKVETQGKTLDQVLKEEEQAYGEELGKLLEHKNEVVFSVSDMVRGKCTFTSIRDIIDTVEDIKRFCEREKGYRILSIESRFGRQVPISDVTLNIVLNEEIVCELQLTLQTNAAAYHFAHIVYEISRSKIFTKCKMVDNMFQQSLQRLSQLINRALLVKNQSSIPEIKHEAIRKAFAVPESKTSSWQTLVADSLTKSQQFRKSSGLSGRVKDEAAELTVAVISLQDPKIDKKELKEKVSSALHSKELSDIAKTVLLQETILRLDLAQDLKSGYYTEFLQYIQDLLGIQVPSFLEYAQSSAILHCYISQLADTQVKNYTIFNFDVQRGITCVSKPEKVLDYQLRLLTQLLDAMCYLQGRQVQEYAEVLLYLLEKQGQKTQYGSLLPIFKLRICQNSISQKELGDQIVNKFRQARQNLVKNEALLVEWQVWNTAVNLLTNSQDQTDFDTFKTYQENYQKAVDLSKISLVELNTTGNATAHYLIAQQLQAIQTKNTQEKQAISEAARTHYEKIVTCGVTPRMAVNFNIKLILDQYKQLQDLVRPNQATTQLVFQQQQSIGQQLQCLVMVKWPNLSLLNLQESGIGEQGCKWLCKAQWPSLSTLILSESSIGDKGCEWLSRGPWPDLTSLNLNVNNISEKGCEWLIKANWPKMQAIDLVGNQIKDKGCEWLVKAKWPNLLRIDLANNGISETGCQWLSQSFWHKLTTISLTSNKVGERGCQYLHKAEWPHLQLAELINMGITDKGIEWLSKSQWPKIQALVLLQNQITLNQDQVKSIFGTDKQIGIAL